MTGSTASSSGIVSGASASRVRAAPPPAVANSSCALASKRARPSRNTEANQAAAR